MGLLIPQLNAVLVDIRDIVRIIHRTPSEASRDFPHRPHPLTTRLALAWTQVWIPGQSHSRVSVTELSRMRRLNRPYLLCPIRIKTLTPRVSKAPQRFPLSSMSNGSVLSPRLNGFETQPEPEGACDLQKCCQGRIPGFRQRFVDVAPVQTGLPRQRAHVTGAGMTLRDCFTQV